MQDAAPIKCTVIALERGDVQGVAFGFQLLHARKPDGNDIQNKGRVVKRKKGNDSETLRDVRAGNDEETLWQVPRPTKVMLLLLAKNTVDELAQLSSN
eukprot:16435883-Heterocapsa_arctica.AAC.1